MTLAPLRDAPFAIQIHAALALLAVALTVAIFALRRGTPLHRIMGRAWVTAMAVVALSSFAIFEIRLLGPFSPIHLLSLFTLVQLGVAVRAARRGDIALHRRVMKGLVFGALMLAGAFTFLPGRIMYAVVTGG